ncbi:MAG: hypothetical protein JO313_04720 [Verrucomicrobia bacterium]|nr:hypothetical protein [Verrucomicrobiota bacterium]MBV9645338.1 hypothetical protein [Verrucomicrobiota bacterium]
MEGKTSASLPVSQKVCKPWHRMVFAQKSGIQEITSGGKKYWYDSTAIRVEFFIV